MVSRSSEVIFKEDLEAIFGKRPWDPIEEIATEAKPSEAITSEEMPTEEVKSLEAPSEEASNTEPTAEA